MASQSEDHIAGITRSNIILNRHFGNPNRFWMTVLGTYVIEPYDAPEPDFAVYPVPVGTPNGTRMTPKLVVEVSKKSYPRDSGIKLRRYAAAGVKDYLILNLNESRLEVYRHPMNETGLKSDWRYDSVTHYYRGQCVTLLAYPDVSILRR